MTNYIIHLSNVARRQLEGLPPEMLERVLNACVELEEDPFQPRPKADIRWLRGPRRMHLRMRVGGYRIIYTVEKSSVFIIKILPRKKAYEWLD